MAIMTKPRFGHADGNVYNATKIRQNVPQGIYDKPQVRRPNPQFVRQWVRDCEATLLPTVQDFAPAVARAKVRALMAQCPGLAAKPLPAIPTIISGRHFSYEKRQGKFYKLGSGVFGSVYQAHDTRTGKLLAVKFFKKGDQTLEETLREAAALQHCTELNLQVCTFFGMAICRDNPEYEKVALVMEYVGTGRNSTMNLYDMRDDPSVSKREIADVYTRLTRAVRDMNEAHYILHDLKEDNVMVTKVAGQWIPKIIDLGQAEFQTSHYDYGIKPEGWEAFMSEYPQCAPETVETGLLVPAGDVYRIGIMMLRATMVRNWLKLKRIAIKCVQPISERPDAGAVIRALTVMRGEMV